MARCINNTYPDFLNLQQDLNIDPSLLESSITLWQDENNLERFPTKEEITKFLAKKNNKPKQYVGSSRILRTISENEEENIISNGVYFLGTIGIQKELKPDIALNIYLKGVYNRMNIISANESAEELKRKLGLLKSKIARAYKILLKEDIKVNSDSIYIDTTEETLDDNVDPNEFDNEESTSVEQTWTDNIASISSISIATIQIKRNIAFLANRYNEGSNKGEIIYDRFGNPELVELEPAYNFLQNSLVNSGSKFELLNRLKNLSEFRTEFKPLYEALINPSNKQLSAQFYKLMNFTKNEKSMTSIKFTEGEGVDIKVFDSDRVNAAKQIIKIWEKNFSNLNIENSFATDKEVVDEKTKTSSIVTTTNKDKFKPLYEDLDNFRKSKTIKSSKQESYNKWSEVLSKVGIIVDPIAFKGYIEDNQKLFDYVQSSVLQSFRYAYEKGTLPLEHSSINTFSKIQAGYQYVDNNSTFTNIDNNKEQTFMMPSASTKLLVSYKSNDRINILDELSKDPSFYNSHLIKILKEHPDDVNIKIEGGIKENKPGSNGVGYSNMSPLELEFTKLCKFVNTTRDATSSKSKIGQVFTLVPSDGSTMPTLQVPIINGKYSKSDNPAFIQVLGANKENNYADNYAELLFDLFSQEQIRIREALKFRNRILELKQLETRTDIENQELKELEDNAIELYDFKYVKESKDYTKGAATQSHDFDIFDNKEKYNNTIKSSLGINFQEAQSLLKTFTYEKSQENELFEIEDHEGHSFESNIRIDIDQESKDKLKNILFAWLVNKRNKQYQNWNNLGLLSKKFKLTKFVGNNLPYSNYEELALEYVFNSFLYSSETQKLFTGDVSFAGNKVNYQKRAKSIVSPSMTPDLEAMDRKTYKLGIIRDIIKSSEFIDNIKLGLENVLKDDTKTISKIVDSYKDINIADGMGIIHYKEAINIYKGLGTDKKFATAFKDLETGNPTRESLNILLPMIKDNHVSVTYDPIRKITVKKYIKNAKFILFPSLVKDTPLQEVYDYMDKTGVYHILYESGIKQGAKGVEQLENKDNKYDLSKLDSIVPEELSYEFWGLQFDTIEHHLDAKNKQGVQVAKLITQGLDDKFKFSNGTTGEELKKEYRKLQADNILEDYKKLIQDIKTDEDVRNLILEQLSDTTDNIIQLFDLDEYGNFKSPLFLNMEFCKKVESILNGLYKNRIVNQKMNGGSFKQASCFGLINKQNFKSLEELPDKYKGGINWLEGSKDKLDFYTYEDGKIKCAKCLLPSWTKEFIKDNNTIDINSLPLELRQIIGYRIPTQSKSSMFALEVVGFLPKEAGSTIILPEEVTKLMGSDFDIDTLYTMIPNFIKNEDGTYSKIIDNSREGRDNKIQDIFRKVLLEPNLFQETIAPLDSDLLKNIRNRGLLLLDKEEIKDSVNLPYIQTDMSIVNMMGKALIGVFANYNANRSIAEDTKLKIIDKDYSIKFNAIEATELYNITNLNKNNIASQISEMLSAAVDNAKELIHYVINSNTYTASVYALILESGHDLTTASYFMLQPSIVKAYDRQKSNSGINNTFEKTIDVIKQDYLSKISNKEVINKLNKELESNKTFNFSDNQMQEAIVVSRYLVANAKDSSTLFKDYINNPKIKSLGLDFKSWNPDSILEDYSTMQIKVIHSFESYKKLSGQRNLILKNQKIDGYNGNSLAHLEILKNNIDGSTKELFSYDDSELINQKVLYKALLSGESTSATNFISKYIPFNKPAFLKSKNSIINKLGIQDKLKNTFTGEKILNKINYEILTAINGNRKSPFFKSKSSSEYIKQLVIDKGLYNTYSDLIKQYPFLKDNYFLRRVDFNKNKELTFDIGILQKRSTERLQNAFQELLESFGVKEEDKQKVREFTFNLIRYSYLTKGFQSGFDSFIKYISSEWLQSDRLGYNDFIKEVQDNLTNPEFISDKLENEIISNLSNVNGIVRFIDTKEDPITVSGNIATVVTNKNLPEFINYYNPKTRKVINLKLIESNRNSLGLTSYKYSIVLPLGRKANSKKAVGLKEYSGEGLNFVEKPIIKNISNINSTGKPIINNKTLNNKGEDIENICKN